VAKKKRAEPKPDPEPLRVAAADALEKYLTGRHKGGRYSTPATR
jgi:hypothetical protein